MSKKKDKFLKGNTNESIWQNLKTIRKFHEMDGFIKRIYYILIR